MKKDYSLLTNYLLENSKHSIVVSYKEIEEIIKSELPDFIYTYPHRFFHNSDSSSYFQYWKKAGYVAKVQPGNKSVEFIKKSLSMKTQKKETEIETPISKKTMSVYEERYEKKVNYAEVLLDEIKRKVDLRKLNTNTSTKYKNIVACIIDAVYSIRANYDYLQPKVEKFSNFFPSDDNSIQIFLESFDIQRLSQQMGRNRTSAKGGILKADACIRFATVLKNHEITSFTDLERTKSSESLIIDLEKIPGQSRYVSIAYFFMLAGDTSKIKIDSRIKDFTYDSLGFNLKSDESYANLYAEVIERLRKDMPHINLRSLDYVLWKIQRTKNK